MRSWLNGRASCAVARANAWSYRIFHGNRIARLARLRMPNSALLPCIFIDPMKIEHKCNIRGATQFQRTLLRDGTWDMQRKNFAEVESADSRYISCAELLGGMKIEQTLEFRLLCKRLLERGEARGMKSAEQVLSYMQRLQGMYQQVAAEGRLLTQAELGRCSHGGEINCALSRDGTLLKTDDGNHRFAVARYLKIPLVPVQISVIHPLLIKAVDGVDAVEYINSIMREVSEKYR